jgi:signal-transduction protein with cAMP-binding, CBS, and nucleotidyltransferase domain
MTGSPTSVSPDLDLATVARTMRDEDIGNVLVVDGEDLRGMVTDRDLVVRGMASGMDPRTTKVGGICSDVTATVRPDDDLDKAVALMRDRAVRRLPVIDGGRPVGIISLGDLALEKDPRSALADISAASPNQ